MHWGGFGMSKRPANTSSELLNEGLVHWRAICGGKPTPAFADFDPMAVPRLLPNVILLGVKPDGSDFQYRIIGETVLKHLLGNYTGQWVSDLAHQTPPSQVHDCLTEAFSARAPVWADSPYIGRNDSFVTKEEIILPFLGDDGAVSRLLVLLEFHSRASSPAI